MKAYLIIIAIAALVIGGLIYLTGGRDESQSVVVLYQAQPVLTRSTVPPADNRSAGADTVSGAIAKIAEAPQAVRTATDAGQALVASSTISNSATGSQTGQGLSQMVETARSMAETGSGALSSLVQSELSNKSLPELIGMNPLLSDSDKEELLSGISRLQAIADEVRAEGHHAPSSPMESLTDIMYLYRNLDDVVEKGSWNPETRRGQSSEGAKPQGVSEPTFKRGSLNDPNLTRMKIDRK